MSALLLWVSIFTAALLVIAGSHVVLAIGDKPVTITPKLALTALFFTIWSAALLLVAAGAVYGLTFPTG